MDRQDRKAMQKLSVMLEAMPAAGSDAVAESLLEATRELEWQHPLGGVPQGLQL